MVEKQTKVFMLQVLLAGKKQNFFNHLGWITLLN